MLANHPRKSTAIVGSLCLSLSILNGCGRGPGKLIEVSEVSIDSSGVELTEPPLDLAGEWATWRGPQGNGIAAGSAPTEWSETSGVKWMSDVPGRGHGSPIVVGDTILLASSKDDQQQQLVLAYSRETGNPLWEKTIHAGNFPSKREIHNKGTNANSTLASDGQHAFIAFFNDQKVTATALTLDGDIAWQEELGAFSSKFGFAPSPVLYKSLVIFAVDNWGGGYISALDAKSGTLAWRIARPAKNSHSTPFIANVAGRDQLLISGCDEVASYDPATGEQFWSTAATSETTCGTMVASSEYIFASGGYPGSQTVCLSATGEKVWDNRVKVYEPSMLLVDDNLFAINDNGIAYCWSASDGKELWKKRLGGSFSSSPVYAGGNIYVSDLSGNTFVFAASSEGYQLIAKNRLGSDAYASPAIIDEEIFMRVGFAGSPRQEKLVCIANP